MPKIICFSGSIRDGSFNTKLAKYASQILNERDGIDAKLIDLADYPMPIFNGDVEAESGLPEQATAFKSLIQNTDGFFIASPEFNGFFTPLLKNAIDWASRPHTDDSYSNDIQTFKGKVAAIAATSPGPLGGLRGLPHLRTLLSEIGTHVIPTQVAVGRANQAFDDKGNLTQDNQIKMINAQIDELVKTVKAFQLNS